MNLDAKGAIKLAKDWLEDFPKEDRPEDVGLEAFRFHDGIWEIALSYVSAKDGPYAGIPFIGEFFPKSRTVNIVVVDDAAESVVEVRSGEGGRERD